MNKYSINDILETITGDKELIGETSGIVITNLKPIAEADNNSLAWLSPTKKELAAHAGTTAAPLVIVAADFDTSIHPTKCFIKVPNPRLTFIQVATALFATKTEWGIHPTASIHPEAEVHPQTYIGAFTYIGKCQVGQGTVIFGHCYLYDGVKVGKNVRIQAGVILGSDGFGYQLTAEGDYQRFPHLGSVQVEDNVHIGANSCIDRGTLGDTVIRQSVKINNLVHIAHNVEVGRHTIVTSNCSINGSNKIGEYCWFAPGVVTIENLKIGNHARMGAGSVVTRNVPDNANMIGNPAIDFRMKAKA